MRNQTFPEQPRCSCPFKAPSGFEPLIVASAPFTRKRRESLHMGLIYVAEGERGVKIGWTGYLHNRIAKLERQTGEFLYLWAYFPGTREDERALHERWAHLALGAEWFRATDELLAWADSLDGARP